jgi:hypothetical protein
MVGDQDSSPVLVLSVLDHSSLVHFIYELNYIINLNNVENLDVQRE